MNMFFNNTHFMYIPCPSCFEAQSSFRMSPLLIKPCSHTRQYICTTVAVVWPGSAITFMSPVMSPVITAFGMTFTNFRNAITYSVSAAFFECMALLSFVHFRKVTFSLPLLRAHFCPNLKMPQSNDDLAQFCAVGSSVEQLQVAL